MGCGCKKKRIVPQVPVAAFARNIEVQKKANGKRIRVRCLNCEVMLRTSGGVYVAAQTKNWFMADVPDVISWMKVGFEFEFMSEEDRQLVESS